MKKILMITFSSLILLSGCKADNTYINWAEKTDNQIQRLNDSNIKYEMRGEEIWIREKDLNKAVACCS